MAKCPGCGCSIPFFRGVPTKTGRHPYACRCGTNSEVSISSAIMWNLFIWMISAAVFLFILLGFPAGEKNDRLAIVSVIACVFFLPYLLGRFVWRWVKLRKVSE